MNQLSNKTKTVAPVPLPEAKVFIKKNVLKNVLAGHPWCFSGAIETRDGSMANGDLCQIWCESRFIGIGYFNHASDISLRILSRQKAAIDSRFFARRFEDLKQQKTAFLPRDTNAYRLAFGESDNLPGLVVDIYDEVAVMQVHTLGIEKLKQQVINGLIHALAPRSIYERSDVAVREKEGLPKDTKGLVYGDEVREVTILENGFKFIVDVAEGQKTGFFLDQRQNRQALVSYCRDRRVLNCFAYSGGFSVYAASVAASVTSLDISKPAIETAKRNLALNGYHGDGCRFIVGDTFDYLKEMDKNSYDLIILDPPSFARHKKQLKNAIKAYITINSKALEKLPAQGLLVSSSCTSHIDQLTFIKILHQSAVNASCQLKVLESKLQPWDHPYNLAFPEGNYLKFYILQKIPIC